MKFLITGGAGTVGRDLTASLLAKGHRVRVLDRDATAFGGVREESLELVAGRLEDARIVREALCGIDVVVHLAWSFSDDPLELLESDLKAHVTLLEASAAAQVGRFLYTSTAVVYGKPLRTPLTEDAPCVVEDARKPFYAIAKLTAEKLALALGRARGLPVSVFRFWWSYGGRIGGRHLRDLIAAARSGRPLRVPEGAGGSFLDHDDLAHAVLLAASREESVGNVFNLATLYLEWKEIAGIVLRITDSSSRLDVVPSAAWDGAAFLADPWDLSTAKAERLLGFRSLFDPLAARRRLEGAIGRCREEMPAAG